MDLVHKAIARLQEAAKLSAFYYDKPLLLAYSGGKDSEVCLELCRRAGVPFEVIYNITTADAPETYYHVKQTFHQLELNGVKCKMLHPQYKGYPTSMYADMELEKCPFCGGEAGFRKSKDSTVWSWWKVACNDCLCGTDYYASQAAAAEVWNRRPEPPSAPLTPEELRNLALKKWVWIDDMDGSKEHGAGSAYYRKSDCYNPEEVFSCGYPGWEIVFEYADYGKTWLAYRQKPKEETHGQNKN